jgi:hypothetical protein
MTLLNAFYLYQTSIILPVVVYGCENWTLTLREECRLRVFENRVLRRVFGPKCDVTGKWKRLHNKELYVLYSSPIPLSDEVKKTEMGRTCGAYG